MAGHAHLNCDWTQQQPVPSPAAEFSPHAQCRVISCAPWAVAERNFSLRSGGVSTKIALSWKDMTILVTFHCAPPIFNRKCDSAWYYGRLRISAISQPLYGLRVANAGQSTFHVLTRITTSENLFRLLTESFIIRGFLFHEYYELYRCSVLV